MSEPVDTEPVSAGITHNHLTNLLDEIGERLNGLHDAFEEHAPNPRMWPHTAAILQSRGIDLAQLGEMLAAALAAYTDAHPIIEVPDDGPGVMLLAAGEHREIWNVAGELYDTNSSEEAAEAYAEVLDGEHGRPELEVRGIALDEDGAVMVLQHLPGEPDAVCQVYIGGCGQGDGDRIQQALTEHGITPGHPRFWPPATPETTFLSFPDGDGLFDAFGRSVEQTDPA